MVKWTVEQQQAIDEKGSNILVAAAAGSGKTAVLVERIIQKVLDEQDPMDIDEMLVATFTNAAAEEMRSRVGVALEKAIAADPTSYHLKKQLSLLPKASISTLHSFCTTVVREHAYLLDVDPGFRIADDVEIDLIRQETVDNLLEDAYSREGEALERFFHVVDMFSSDRSDVHVSELILEFYRYAMENPWPEKWLHDIAETYNLPEDCKEDDLFWLDVLKESIRDELTGFEVKTEQAITIAREPDGPYHYLEALEADLALIHEAKAIVGDWNALQSFFSASKLKSLSRKKIECNEDKREKIQHIRKGFRDDWNGLVKGWFSRNLAGHLADMRTLYPAIQEITELTITFKQRFSQVKKEKALLDFSDLEHFCLAILTEPTSTEGNIIPSRVANAYRHQFKEVLVDEYQDINIVQESILTVVSNQEDAGNMFMVGDVKQSVYRFRHAEPALFIQKYKQFQDDPTVGLRIDLAKNFRSRKDVLYGANFVFRQIFDEALGDIAYDEAAELVYGNLSYDEVPLDDKEVELQLIDREGVGNERAEKNSESAEDLINAQLEARAYAKKIKTWIGTDGETPLQVIDKATGQKRDVQYRDIVVLQRALTDAPTIVDELTKQGIPVYAELRTGYFVAIEMQVMINVLKIIDNPFQDVPLASVLRSPIVGLDEEALAQIRLANQRTTFYEALQIYVRRENDCHLQQFLHQLQSFRALAKEGALSELIWNIYRETGYYDFVGGIPGGRQRQANLRALYDRARGYESTSFRGLFRFLRLIERMKEQEKDLGEARALSEQEDVVRIMTIHKSKGLEFPVVIIGGMNKQFNFQDMKSKSMLDKDLGFAMKFIDPEKRITYPTLYYKALQQVEHQKMLAEQMRVLYVAMTRAKEKLFMVGHVRSVEKELEKWAAVLEHEGWVLPMTQRKKAKTFLDWVGPALIRHEQNEQLRQGDGTTSVWREVAEDTSNWRIDIQPAEAFTNMSVQEEVKGDNWQGLITDWNSSQLATSPEMDQVDAVLSHQYAYTEATVTNAKQSVTEIKRRQEVADEYSGQRLTQSFRAPLVKRPRFMQEEHTLSAAEIGTAMHAVMQHLPFDLHHDVASIQSCIDTFVEQEKLSVQEAETINVSALEDFFSTDLAHKMDAAHMLEREVPFTYTLDADEVYPNWQGAEMEKVLIQGVIDCLMYTDEGLVIVDYKTDIIQDETVAESTISKLKERYQVQLTLYKQAIEDITKQKVIGTYLYFFDKNLTVIL